MAVSHLCHRTHLLLLLVTVLFMVSSVGAQRSYRRRVGLLRSTNHLPTDPWQLFNISITQTANKTEGMQMLTIRFARNFRAVVCISYRLTAVITREVIKRIASVKY